MTHTVHIQVAYKQHTMPLSSCPKYCRRIEMGAHCRLKIMFSHIRRILSSKLSSKCSAIYRLADLLTLSTYSKRSTWKPPSMLNAFGNLLHTSRQPQMYWMFTIIHITYASSKRNCQSFQRHSPFAPSRTHISGNNAFVDMWDLFVSKGKKMYVIKSKKATK